MNIHKPIPFTWSWSKLNQYRTCPRRLFEVDIQKNYKDAGNANRKWGDEFHAAMAKRLITKRLLPPEYKAFESAAKWVEDSVGDGQLRVELKLAITREFQPCGYFDHNVWYRCVIDVLIIKGTHAVLIDWKTGKVKPEAEQLALNAQCVIAFFPQVQVVSTRYRWISQPEPTTTDEHFTSGPSRYLEESGQTLALNSLQDMWNGLLPELRDMERAYAERDFPPTPCGLCVAHCPVTRCEYYGRGSR